MQGSESLKGKKVEIKMMASTCYTGIFADCDEREIMLETPKTPFYLQWPLVEYIREIKPATVKPRVTKGKKTPKSNAESAAEMRDRLDRHNRDADETAAAMAEDEEETDFDDRDYVV